MYCAERRRPGGECGSECIDVFVLCKLDVVFSTQVVDFGAFFAEIYLYLDAMCGYQPCCAYCRAVSENRCLWRISCVLQRRRRTGLNATY